MQLIFASHFCTMRRSAVAFCAYSSLHPRAVNRLTAAMASSSSGNALVQNTFEKLRNDKDQVLLLDGGTGEELFRQGVPDDRKIWSATAVVNPQYHPILQQVHQSFVDAGSQAITTNSYGITPGVGFSEAEIATYAAEAGRLARESVVSTSTLVLGSLGPLVESYRPDMILPHDEGVRIYKIYTKALSPHVDCFLAETMSSLEESLQAVEAVASEKPMLVSYTLGSDGALRSGEKATHAIHQLFEFAKQHSAHIMGVLFNCSEPEAITIALQQVRNDPSLKNIILGAYANRLTPVASDWTIQESDGPQEMRSDLTPDEYYNKFVSKWVTQYNTQLVGGCCGIAPEHIEYLSQHLKK